MGSYLSIGFVYDKPREILSTQLEYLVQYLLSSIYEIKSFKVSKDVGGEEWIESNSANYFFTSDLYILLSDLFYGEVHLVCDFLGYKEQELVIRVEKEANYFGLLIEISDAELLYSSNSEDLDSVTNKIISFIQSFHAYSQYDYAFCDTEAKVEYSFKQYNSINEPLYSIVIIPSIDKFTTIFKVLKSNWMIDGLTSR